MSDSLWAARLEDLLGRIASAQPTPGGGPVAAITGALGVGLTRMAVAVNEGATVSERHGSPLASLKERIVPAADADVHNFESVMSAVRLPRGDGTQREGRLQAIEVTREDVS